MDHACEIGVLGEVTRGAEQHRGMAVMPACVHLARNGRAMVGAGRLLDVERVEIRPQPDRALAGPGALERADDAGPGDPLGDLDSPGPEVLGDNGGGAPLLEAGLRMAMNVAADGDEFGFVGLQTLENCGAIRVHWLSSAVLSVLTQTPLGVFPSAASRVHRVLSVPHLATPQ